jgi:hypothetical protein
MVENFDIKKELCDRMWHLLEFYQNYVDKKYLDGVLRNIWSS